MTKNPILILAVLLLTACGSESANEAPAAAASEPVSVSGEAAYLEYCASCHETGLEGTPIVGQAADWEGRSNLWQAVMMEHAKSGYLDMPAKGGNPDIPDKTIEAAVEYMLERTYPELPPDQ